ncbi:MAG: hypothetical protein AB8F95_19835 [Bacteroidia bacterium]
MRYLSLLLFCLFLISITSCDKPLELEQDDNTPALLLEFHEVDNETILSWDKVDHPHFQGYWLLRVPEDEIEIKDSIDIRRFEVLFSTSDSSQTSYIDSTYVPAGDGLFYQAFAQIGDRWISSNKQASKGDLVSIRGRAIGDEIIGGDGFLYFGLTNPLEEDDFLVCYNIEQKRIEKQETLIKTSRTMEMAFGDFGTGEKELALYYYDDGIGSLVFINPQTLTVNETISTAGFVYEMLALPTGMLGVVFGGANTIQAFNRNGNQWGEPFNYSTEGTPTGFDLVQNIPGKNELVLFSYPRFIGRLAYDREGNFSLLTSSTVPNANINSSILEIDPQGRYCLANPTGWLFFTQNFQALTTVASQFSKVAKCSGFSSTGEEILLASNDNPSVLYVFARSNLKLSHKQTLLSGFAPRKIIRIDKQAYLLVTNTIEPLSTMLWAI